jgi:hypothetical protein
MHALSRQASPLCLASCCRQPFSVPQRQRTPQLQPAGTLWQHEHKLPGVGVHLHGRWQPTEETNGVAGWSQTLGKIDLQLQNSNCYLSCHWTKPSCNPTWYYFFNSSPTIKQLVCYMQKKHKLSEDRNTQKKILGWQENKNNFKLQKRLRMKYIKGVAVKSRKRKQKKGK